MAEWTPDFHCYLDAQGRCTAPFPDEMTPDLLRRFYQAMVRVRIYDKQAIALQRTGKLGTYPSHLGAEAIGIGCGYAMQPNDIYVPYYRDMPALYLRGVSMQKNLQYWGGDERGSDFRTKDGELSEDFPICVPIATQVTHAVGLATALKIKKEKRCVVVSIGDGGTSKGDFLEGLNCAGVWHLPLVILVNNNQWAISVPRSIQCAAKTLAQKGIGAGVNCEQVDGNDVIAVYTRVKHALERAQLGKGPTLIEALSYRLCDHTTADDASRYRPEGELAQAWENEPNKRLRLYLESENFWDDRQEQALLESAHQEVTYAVEQYLNGPPQSPQAIFDYLYEQMPTPMMDQYQQLQQCRRGGDANE